MKPIKTIAVLSILDNSYLNRKFESNIFIINEVMPI